MNERERLIELMEQATNGSCHVEDVADYLLENGVGIRIKTIIISGHLSSVGCPYPNHRRERLRMDKQRLTDEQVIKALECCKSENGNDCEDCPCQNITYEQGNGGCCNALMESALDIINRLKAENEKKSKAVVKAAQEVVDIKIELKSMRSAANSLKMHLKKYQDIESIINEFWTGLEKLSMFKGKKKPTLEELLEYIEQVKVEVYKEFAERLTGILGFDKLPGTVIKCHIDNLLAELTPTLNKLPHNSLCETETYEGEMKNDFKG